MSVIAGEQELQLDNVALKHRNVQVKLKKNKGANMRILVLHFLTLIGTTCHKDDSKLNRTKYNSHKLYEQNWLYI